MVSSSSLSLRSLSFFASLLLLCLSLTTTTVICQETEVNPVSSDPAGSNGQNNVPRSFTIQDNRWVLDGRPIVLKSGAIHYFRVPPSQWNDRIQRMKALGLNTIEMYIPWNFHELDFDGQTIDFTSPWRNIQKFIELVQSANMLLMVRPGPYICGEWEFGGLPARLLAIPGIALRTFHPAYMEEVTKWFDVLLPMLQPYLYNNKNDNDGVGGAGAGRGPIIALQVENEYGSFGDVSNVKRDETYMRSLVSQLRSHLGYDVILYTTDGGSLTLMKRGSLPDDSVVTLGDFGPFAVNLAPGVFSAGNAAQVSIAAQNAMNPRGYSPPMVTEYYTGWLTHWGESMANTATWLVAGSLEYMLQMNMSVNLYMGHGGTNFGYWSGANGIGKQVSYDITSYDYNCPISECGLHNVGSDGLDKYTTLREIFIKYHDDQQQHGNVMMAGEEEGQGRMIPEEPSPPKMINLGNVTFTQMSKPNTFVSWMKSYVEPTVSTGPQTFEELRQRFGFVLYSTSYENSGVGTLDLLQVHDRAQVYENEEWIKTVARTDGNYLVPIEPDSSGTLDILVENMGRINYGQGMYDSKGLPLGAALNGKSLMNWEHYGLELEAKHFEEMDTTSLVVPVSITDDSSSSTIAPDGDDGGSLSMSEKKKKTRIPNVFYNGTFTIDGDIIPDGTYVDMSHFRKGYVWINGNNLGRYWTPMGPLLTLFVPGEFLVTGDNNVLVFELDGSGEEHLGVEFVDRPRYGKGAFEEPNLGASSSFAGEGRRGRSMMYSPTVHSGLGSFWT